VLQIQTVPPSITVLEKLIVTQLVRKVPVFYKPEKFITVFRTEGRGGLSGPKWIQSTPSHPTP